MAGGTRRNISGCLFVALCYLWFCLSTPVKKRAVNWTHGQTTVPPTPTRHYDEILYINLSYYPFHTHNSGGVLVWETNLHQRYDTLCLRRLINTLIPPPPLRISKKKKEYLLAEFCMHYQNYFFGKNNAVYMLQLATAQKISRYFLTPQFST